MRSNGQTYRGGVQHIKKLFRYYSMGGDRKIKYQNPFSIFDL